MARISCNLIAGLHRQWGLLFTRNDAVLELLETLVWLLIPYSSLDAVLGHYNGVLASVVGLCAGHSLGKLCHVLACMFTVWRINWDMESYRAIQQVEKESDSMTLLV